MKNIKVIVNVRYELIETISSLMSIIGFSEAMGRILGALILTDLPMSQKELSKVTGYSVSIVSVNLSVLKRVGIVSEVRGNKVRRYALSSSLTDIIERFLGRFLEEGLNVLERRIRRNIGSFDEVARKGIMKLLSDVQKTRYLLYLTLMLMRKVKDMPLGEFLRMYNSIRKQVIPLLNKA
ncbi:MAG TPA: hypothetical protein ENF80_05125 [Thermofilum sp.]|nr:hypothetical protein [Thermofilum sp.]